MRKIKREVKIGSVTIGGHNPIAVQTMLSVPVEDIAGNVAQAQRCEAAGCQILRVTCPTPEDAKCIEAVKKAVNIPIVADIHFDYRAALACAAVGVDKIRINPGNIGDDDRVKAGGGCLPSAQHPHPHRCQRRQPGKCISLPNTAHLRRKQCGKCAVSCAPSGKVRL